MNELSPQPELELGLYTHYKGKQYKVTNLVMHSESLKWHVLYRPMYDSEVKLWVRPYDMFIETVEVNGKRVPRFTKE